MDKHSAGAWLSVILKTSTNATTQQISFTLLATAIEVDTGVTID
jgi:hypothetical protein